MRNRTRIFTILSICALYGLNAQNTKLEANVGLSWRSTAHRLVSAEKLGDFNGQRTCCYDSERGLQGFGLDAGLEWLFAEKLQLEYNPRFRYDYAGSSANYEFILDHNINLTRNAGQFAYGIGYSLINSGKDFTDEDGNKNDLGLSSYNAVGRMVIFKEMEMEVKAMYIPNGFYGFFPELEKDEPHMAYSLRFIYPLWRKSE
ncbi:MAG: hypothetical protein RIF46_15375 [Cyclobacteriaceae bacterium]